MQIARFIALSLAFAFAPAAAQSQESSGAKPCIPIDKASFIVEKPGNYCLVKDIYTRLDFADHSAESSIVDIRASNVTIDLQGHRAGRGWLFVQHGGNGIMIVNERHMPPHSNIVIKNGVLSDFDSGVYFYRSAFKIDPVRRQLEKLGDKDFLYRPANIRIINVIFKNCSNDFDFFDLADDPSMPSASR